MGLKRNNPGCCCEVVCGDSLLVTISGVTNGSCSSCSTQYNETVVTAPGVLSGDCNTCTKTASSVHCAFTFGQSSTPCFDDDDDSLICMFTATDGKKYISVKLEDETLGGFGDTFASWLKEVPAFTLPQTLTRSHQCLVDDSKCNFTNAEILLEAG